MKIEEEIKQVKVFSNHHHKAAVNLVFTYSWYCEKAKKFLEEFDLTQQQFNILRILRGAGTPISTLQIRDRMLDKMSDTSRIVDRLVIKKVVKKVVNKKDKRLVDVTITDKGKGLLTKIDEKQHMLDGILSGLNQDEAVLFSNLLDKIRSTED